MIKKVNFKILTTLLVVTALITSCGVSKMTKKSETVGYKVTPEILETHGGKVAVDIKGTFPAKYFNKKASVEFTPVLNYEGGSTTLKPITLQGEKAEGNGTVINSKTGGSFTYSDEIDFVPGMSAATLDVNPKVTLKKKSADLGQVKLADGVIATSTRIFHDEKFILAEHGYEKETIIAKSADIYFAKNLSNLSMYVPFNKDKASKEKREALNEFISQGWAIKNIEINAWASPEGEETFNQGLSDRRTKTAAKYINKQFRKLNRAKDSKVTVKNPEKEVAFATYAKGEDWNGFLKAVKNSDIADKNTIMNVVNSQSDIAKREQEIRNMTVVYKEIEDEILPSLRRAEITVNCYEPKRTDEQIAELSTSNPDSLTKEELLFAATLTNELKTQLNIYKSAIELHPNCWVSYNNLAFVYAKMNKYDEAAKYLKIANDKASNNGIIINNLGAVSSVNEDYAKAESLYGQAKKLGINTSYNQGIVEITKANYTKALTLLKGKKCNYNIALAQLLSDNASGAAAQLKCAPKNAATNYLMAVIAARSGNTEDMLKCLKDAVSADAEYKAEAMKDREFIKYFDNAEFQNIVK